jgi:hypothetical protein
MVPFIDLSLFIFIEYTNLAKSKFTLIEIGIKELNKIRILKNEIGRYFQLGVNKSICTRVIENKKKNNILDKRFIYQSKIPNFARGDLVPSDILDYFPVYTTKPNALPLANTVLAHIVFYKVSFYFLIYYV